MKKSLTLTQQALLLQKSYAFTGLFEDENGNYYNLGKVHVFNGGYVIATCGNTVGFYVGCQMSMSVNTDKICISHSYGYIYDFKNEAEHIQGIEKCLLNLQEHLASSYEL